MKNGEKRICLNLTTVEYEELYKAVRARWDNVPAIDEYDGQLAAIFNLVAKMEANYDRNGCP